MAHRHNVLIVDDDADTRDGLATLLSLEDVTVRTAANGIEALASIGDMPAPCVVLLDCRMPEMDSASLIELLRAAIPNVAIVLITGDTDAAAHAREWGANDTMLKPIEPLALREVIDRYCGV